MVGKTELVNVGRQTDGWRATRPSHASRTTCGGGFSCQLTLHSRVPSLTHEYTPECGDWVSPSGQLPGPEYPVGAQTNIQAKPTNKSKPMSTLSTWIKVTGKLPAQPVKIGHSGFANVHPAEAECDFCVLKSLAQPVTF